MNSSDSYFIGIDVGTGSARAGIFDGRGTLIALAVKETQTWKSDTDHRIFEQSTADIWKSICFCVQQSLTSANLSKEAIKGIGLDATCSLAVTDLEGDPITITAGDLCGAPGERNVILWADHRAETEAELINISGSVVLDYVGGAMSLEMEIPKILWLKNHMPSSAFNRCQFFDLPDYLTYRATSSLQRSACSLVCKCSYLPQSGWQSDFFENIGLSELVKSHYKQMGDDEILTAGKPVGNGLNMQAASELGLLPGTPVGSAVIDAYAGWIGTVAARYFTRSQFEYLSPPSQLDESRHRLAVVAGTSTCHLVQSPEAVFVPGVWGPYRDAIFPGWWMNEGGQSSTGQLIDFVIKSHPAYDKLQHLAKEQGTGIYEWKDLALELDKQLSETGCKTTTELTKHVHFYPDFHGNRSPLADPKMKGSIVGLTLDNSLGDLARKFNVTLEAIALQTRHIVDEMNMCGHDVREIYMSGGQSGNLSLMQLIADVCSLPVVLPSSHSTAVVLGSAVLARCAGEQSEKRSVSVERLWEIMVEMTPPGTIIQPTQNKEVTKLLSVKYKIFRETIVIQKRWREEMEQSNIDWGGVLIAFKFAAWRLPQ